MSLKDIGNEKMLDRRDVHSVVLPVIRQSGKRRTPISKVIHSKLVAVKHEDSGVETDISSPGRMGIGPLIVHPVSVEEQKVSSTLISPTDVSSPFGFTEVTERLETLKVRSESIVKSVSTGNLAALPQFSSGLLGTSDDVQTKTKKSLSPPMIGGKMSSCLDLSDPSSSNSAHKPTSKWFVDFADRQNSNESVVSSSPQPLNGGSSGRTTRSSDKDSSLPENDLGTPRSVGSEAAEITSLTRPNIRRRVFAGSLRAADSVVSSASVKSVGSIGKGSSHEGSTGSGQVLLTPVSVKQARQRNFLIGKCASEQDELERFFPEGMATIFVGTWNMSGKMPSRIILEDWLLPESMLNLSDVYMIGVQEGPTDINDWREWEIAIQEVIGPSHVLFHSASLGVQHLCLFVRREIIWHLSNPEPCIFGTRYVNVQKAKGAVAIAFQLFGTSILCISCHLSSDMNKVNSRIADYWQIARGLKFPSIEDIRSPGSDVTEYFDAVFWAGDMNFRIDGARSDVESLTTQIIQQNHSDYTQILSQDQLFKNSSKGSVFVGFREGNIRFPPTYKYDIGTSTFDTSAKQRVPSYTDRILFREKRSGTLDCGLYCSLASIVHSDHKPVCGVFSVKLKPGNTHASPGGVFKRDVYQQGISQRNAAMLQSPARSRSKVCSIQ